MTAALTALEYRVSGLDIKPERFARAIATLGLDVARCDVETEVVPFEAETFDALLFNELFEHLRIDPVFTLGEAHRVLKPGGTFMCLEFSRPVNPVFRWLYDIYSFYAMPFLGQLLAGSAESYSCLPETIRLFHLPDEMSVILTRIGFSHVRYRRLTHGIAVVHVGRKG